MALSRQKFKIFLVLFVFSYFTVCLGSSLKDDPKFVTVSANDEFLHGKSPSTPAEVNSLEAESESELEEEATGASGPGLCLIYDQFNFYF